MSRGYWIGESIQNAVPETLAVLAALLTRLGDPLVLAVLLFVLYWTADATKWIAVIGLALSGVGLVLALKHAFALPRPARSPAPVGSLPLGAQWVYETAARADGYGFPSGHAMGSTIVYGLLADAATVGRKRTRYAVAGALVLTISLTRVVLGVHFLIDVVVGIAAGVLFVLFGKWLLARARTDRATVALGLAVAVGGVALAIAPGSPDVVLYLGLALGACVGWQVVLLDRLLGIGPRRWVGDVPVADAYRGSLATLGLVALGGLCLAGLVEPRAARSGGAGIVVVGAVAGPVLLRSRTVASPRQFLANWQQHVTVEAGVFRTHLQQYDPVVYDRSVLRVGLLLYVVPAAIAVESFSEPVQLPSIVIDLLDGPFLILVAGPVGLLKDLLFGPLGLEGFFEVPVVGEALVLGSLLLVYLASASVLCNCARLLDGLPVPDTLSGADEPATGVETDQHARAPESGQQ